MILSLIILTLSVFILVIGIVVGNLLLTRFLIKKSSEDAIEKQIEENLYNSAKEYSNAIMEIFNGYSSTLEALTRIVLSAMHRDDQLFNQTYVNGFPVVGQEKYKLIYDHIPASMQARPDEYPTIYYENANITL